MCYYFQVLCMGVLILIHQYLVLVFLEFWLINLVNRMLLFSRFKYGNLEFDSLIFSMVFFFGILANQSS